MVSLGEVVKAQGRYGDMKIYPYLYGEDLLQQIEKVFISGNLNKFFKIRGYRFKGNSLILGIEGINTIKEAEELVGFSIMVREDDLPVLPDGSYYTSDIEGMKVIDEDDLYIGRIKAIFSNGSNDVYIINDGPFGEFYFPAIKRYIINIDVKNKEMTINMPEGLVDKN